MLKSSLCSLPVCLRRHEVQLLQIMGPRLLLLDKGLLLHGASKAWSKICWGPAVSFSWRRHSLAAAGRQESRLCGESPVSQTVSQSFLHTRGVGTPKSCEFCEDRSLNSSVGATWAWSSAESPSKTLARLNRWLCHRGMRLSIILNGQGMEDGGMIMDQSRRLRPGPSGTAYMAITPFFVPCKTAHEIAAKLHWER